MTKEKALALRKAMDIAASFLSDEQALSVPELYRAWDSTSTYAVGDRRVYNDVLYRCLTAHTSQADWKPDAAPSLWTKVLTSDDGTILSWEQPDSTNPYMIGDKVIHNDQTWISIVDNNVWEPGVYGWEII